MDKPSEEAPMFSETEFREIFGILKKRAEILFCEVTKEQKSFNEIANENLRLITLSTNPEPGANYVQEVRCAHPANDPCGALPMFFMAMSGFLGTAKNADGTPESRLKGILRGAENLGIAYGVWYANDFIKDARSKEARDKAMSKHASHTAPDKAAVREWWLKWQEEPSLYQTKAAFDEAMSDKTGRKIRTISKWRIELQNEQGQSAGKVRPSAGMHGHPAG